MDKGLTQEQVAQAMEWSLSKMNRIEKAKTGISANDLKALLPLYGITAQDRTEELLSLARASRQTPWWRGYADVAPSTVLELIDYENAATAISQFEPMFAPGICRPRTRPGGPAGPPMVTGLRPSAWSASDKAP